MEWWAACTRRDRRSAGGAAEHHWGPELADVSVPLPARPDATGVPSVGRMKSARSTGDRGHPHPMRSQDHGYPDRHSGRALGVAITHGRVNRTPDDLSPRESPARALHRGRPPRASGRGRQVERPGEGRTGESPRTEVVQPRTRTEPRRERRCQLCGRHEARGAARGAMTKSANLVSTRSFRAVEPSVRQGNKRVGCPAFAALREGRDADTDSGVERL